jgi:hypothetical protein
MWNLCEDVREKLTFRFGKERKGRYVNISSESLKNMINNLSINNG